MQIPFEKWQGCYNDFIVVYEDNPQDNLQSLREASLGLCSRIGNGIGADGILHLTRLPDGSYKLTIINSDGSLAETCGNGIRCAAGFLKKRGLHSSAENGAGFVDLELQSGYQAHCQFHGEDGAFVLVTMGIAKAISGKEAEIEGLLLDLEKEQNLSLRKNHLLINILNNHIVAEPGGDVSQLAKRLGPPLQAYDKGDGINVHIIEEKKVTKEDLSRSEREAGITIQKLWRAVTWERGAGETMACGSGACSIAAYGYDRDKSLSGWVAIDMPGGRLYVQKDKTSGLYSLLGPAEFVFSGVIS